MSSKLFKLESHAMRSIANVHFVWLDSLLSLTLIGFLTCACQSLTVLKCPPLILKSTNVLSQSSSRSSWVSSCGPPLLLRQCAVDRFRVTHDSLWLPSVIITESRAKIFEFPITRHLHTWSHATRADRKCCPKFSVSLEGDLYREFLSGIAHEIKLERTVGRVVGQVIEHAWLDPHLVTMKFECGD